MSVNTFPVLFDGTALNATVDTIYTVPSDLSGNILQELQLKLTNITNTQQQVSAWAVPSGQSAADRYALALDHPIAPNSFILIPVQRLAAGGSIQASTVNAGTVNIAPVGGKIHTP